MNAADVNLDDLPAYQEQGDGPLLPPTATAVAVAQQEVERRNGSVSGSGNANGDGRGRPRQDDDTPVEPPPGYEEAQMASLQWEAERRDNESGR